MAEINLNDLLDKKQSDEGTPKSYEKKELVNFNRQVETLTVEERKQVDTIKESINLVTANAIAQYGIAQHTIKRGAIAAVRPGRSRLLYQRLMKHVPFRSLHIGA